jgi:H+/gluconate symporter-like permease
MGAIHATGFTEQMHAVLPGNVYLKATNYEQAEDKTEYSYTIIRKSTQTTFATFRARPLPGCCGVLVVYYLRPSYKNPKTAEKTFKDVAEMIIDAAGRARFGQVIFTQTVASSGERVLNSMKMNGIVMFTNWKTGNKVCTITFQTHEPPKAKTIPNFDGE